MDERFYNIFMYLYNKNILEYGQIARNGTESMIPDTEGCSNMYYESLNWGAQVCTLLANPPSPMVCVRLLRMTHFQTLDCAIKNENRSGHDS